VAIASLAIVVLRVLCISSEYSSGMIRTSLIAVPKRGRVLAAKALVFAGVTFVVGEVTCFVAFFVGQALISGHAPHAAHSAHTLQPWPGFGVMCLFVAIVYAIAWTLLDRRDA
jgi:ABC-2 type transport system permease protein